jgi:putative PEP-CTERM system histidine kinase
MGDSASQFWPLASYVVHLLGAIGAAVVSVWLIPRRARFGAAGSAIIAGLFLTASWCLAVIAAGTSGPAESLAEAARNMAWLIVIYRLFAIDGRHESLAPIRPVVIVLAAVELMHLGVEYYLVHIVSSPLAGPVAFNFAVMMRLLVTVGALVLVHNLYVGASHTAQIALRWPAGGLAVLWAVDLNLYTIAYLGGRWPEELAISRGLAVLLLAGLLALGGARSRDSLRLRPSRAVAFQTFSLLVIGSYLVAMVAIAQWLSFAGGDFARLMELAFLTAASALAILLLPSRRLRGWLKVILAKHLFQHRYDYREEWLRFTRTIGNNGDEALALGERVVQAIADIAESGSGLLLIPGEQGDLALAARWQWASAEVPAIALPRGSVAFFERDGFIVDLDDIRRGEGERSSEIAVPEWLVDEPRAWALVPLIHYERLVGLVVLARPAVKRKLDWEDFDLLRVVGQQLASYLAENAVQEALAESSRFDDFHRRIAFVMHDIKNLASQLSLLARNAELHAEKPAFREDMLLTLRNSADKLTTLLARLSRYGGGVVEQIATVAGGDIARQVVRQFGGTHQVILAECSDCEVSANSEALEQVLLHLIQNAIDASTEDSPVFLTLVTDGLNARFDVIDSGSGMSPEFVRTRLFKPFVSSKQGGFGIGAYEARELVRAMRGRLDVESREDLGSRFTVRLPLASTSDLRDTIRENSQRLAS